MISIFSKIKKKFIDFSITSQKRILLLIPGILLLIVISALYFINSDSSENGDVTDSDSPAVTVTSYPENSSPETETPAEETTNELGDSLDIYEPVIKEIRNAIDNFDGRAGVYVIDLSTRKGFGINENSPFVAANSIKLPIITLLYNEVAQGNLSFTDTVAYDSRPYPEGDMSEGTGFIIGHTDGTEFSVRRIAQLAITISDNIAANMAIRKLGGIDEISLFLDRISATVPYRGEVLYQDFQGNEVFGRHRSSPRDLAIYARYLYDLWERDPDIYQPLIDDLASTVFDFGIRENIPEEIAVAHKIGSNSVLNTENDVGIVFSEVPFVIAVTTESDDRDSARQLISDISFMVYEFLNNN